MSRLCTDNLLRPAQAQRSGTGLVHSLFLVLTLLPFVGCSWVDSTGTQPDAPVFTLDQGNVLDLIENQPLYLDPRDNIDPDGKVVAWRWGDTPIEAGNLPGCRGINGFNSEFAAPDLAQACVSDSNCELYFDQESIDNGGGEHDVFLLRPPVLKAPVGVTYQLFSTQANGQQDTSNFTFCLISVNEAPEAVDDFFSVVEGTELRVTRRGPHLLSNDVDDVDLSNEALTVDPVPVSAPRFASEFALASDGTFVYLPRVGLTGADSFQYQVSDGQSTATATATITVVSADVPPEFNGPVVLPDVVVGIDLSFSLARYFSDPEGSQLAFSASGLPLGLEVTPTGVLQGAVLAGSSGVYVAVITVTDGVSTITVNLDIDVAANEPPLTRLIPAQSVAEGSTVALPVAAYFVDPEGQDLIFGLTTPNGIALGIDRRTGVISGFATNAGEYTIRVVASDGVNSAVASEFDLVVTPTPNRRPVYSGSIGNQTIELGDSVVSIIPEFSDPDGDTLSYSLNGAVPLGIVINARTGVISGAPTVLGIFRNLSIRATDAGRLSVSSDTFSLIITAAVPNSDPVYTGSILDQTVNRGATIEPISGNFSDPDGDVLEYSVVGDLPVGLSINVDGFITGIPSQAGRSGQLRILATDGDGASVRSDQFKIIVIQPAVVVNSPPLFSEIADVLTEAGENIAIDASATDADEDALEYSLAGSAARFLDINENGEIAGSIAVAGEYQLVVSVTDGESSTSIGIDITITAAVSSINSPPTVADIPNRAVTGSFSYDVSFVFEDDDGDTLSFTAINLPTGVSITARGVISGVSTSANRGAYFIVVSASDGRGGSVADGFRLTII